MGDDVGDRRSGGSRKPAFSADWHEAAIEDSKAKTCTLGWGLVMNERFGKHQRGKRKTQDSKPLGLRFGTGSVGELCASLALGCDPRLGNMKGENGSTQSTIKASPA